MKRVLLYVFILGCLATCSHLSLVPAKGYKEGSSYYSIDTSLKKENFQMMSGKEETATNKVVEAGYGVYLSELDPLDSIQLISVWFIDETSLDTLPLKKRYSVFHDEEIKCFDSIQSTPFVVKLDPPKVDTSYKYKEMSVFH